MKRMHIHVAFDNLNDSILFCSAMFCKAKPTILKDIYCKWELTDPAVNFAISKRGAKPGVDHIGIEVETDAELEEMNARFAAAELPVQIQTDATCCQAKSDKAWTVDPQGVVWETFRAQDSAPVYGVTHNRSHAQTPEACYTAAASMVTITRMK